MTGGRALERRRMTAEEVLAIFVTQHRWQSEWDPEADSSAVLTCESTVAEWRDACDLVGWRDLGRALTREFRVDIDQEEWRRVLTPPRQRTLRDVCELLATRAWALRTRPIRVLGRDCPEAGAFFGILAVLRQAGVPCGLIHPSTRLIGYTRTYTEAFVRDVSFLSSGALPCLLRRPSSSRGSRRSATSRASSVEQPPRRAGAPKTRLEIPKVTL